MRYWFVILSAVVVVGFAVAQDDAPKTANQKPATKTKPADKKDSVELDLAADPNPLGNKSSNKPAVLNKISYAFGMQLGRSARLQGVEIDPKTVLKGIEDALQDKPAAFTDEEITEAFKAYEKIRKQAATAKNQKFLDENKEKEGVKVLPSGLQYKVVRATKGASPKATDKVRVHYRGKLTDGKVFDQSYFDETPVKSDEAAEFPVNRVIKGWTEALQKMKVGEKWQLVIPPELAYGEGGTPGGPIGPNAVLLFDVELIAIVE